jgi:hypothetical protein
VRNLAIIKVFSLFFSCLKIEMNPNSQILKTFPLATDKLYLHFNQLFPFFFILEKNFEQRQIMSDQQENQQENTQDLSGKTLTVKFQLDESENFLAINFPFEISFHDFLDDIAKKFQIPSSYLKAFHQKNCLVEIPENSLLKELNSNDFGIIEIKLKLTEEAIKQGASLDTTIYYSHFNLPDIITVHILDENENGDCISRDVVVEIENKSIKKPFIGGYVDKKTSNILNCDVTLTCLKINSNNFSCYFRN